MIDTPPYLQKHDVIGIVCPSGSMPVEKASECIRVLNEEWGFQTKAGKTLGNAFNYFSGTDEERLNDFQQMLDDDEAVSYTHLRAHETGRNLVCRLLLEKKKK